jgi:hypothetical protein
LLKIITFYFWRSWTAACYKAVLLSFTLLVRLPFCPSVFLSTCKSLGAAELEFMKLDIDVDASLLGCYIIIVVIIP